MLTELWRETYQMENKDEENSETPETPELIIYNDAQRWWVNISDNCTTTIGQFKDSIKLQEAIRDMANSKVQEEKDLNS